MLVSRLLLNIYDTQISVSFTGFVGYPIKLDAATTPTRSQNLTLAGHYKQEAASGYTADVRVRYLF